MKIRVQFKDPDAIYEAIEAAVKRSVAELSGVSPTERELILEARQEEVSEFCTRWFESGDYCVVEIDSS
ncbi:MAG: hypothetical protein WC505_07115 [Patescibacteria group bacterium]